MKPAETMKEVFQRFTPGVNLEDYDNFYVDIFQDKMAEFSLELENLQYPSKTYLIAGQSGNGKSTALYQLSKKEELLKDYEIKYLSGKQAFEYMNEIDVADVLFNIAYLLLEGKEDLKAKFGEDLEKLNKLNDDELKEQIKKIDDETGKAELKASIGAGLSIAGLFKSVSDFTASYASSSSVRKSAKEILKFKKTDLNKLINDIIEDYEKKIIVIIDDLEKRKDVNYLFTDESQLSSLSSLKITKIIATPIHLARSARLAFGEQKQFGLKLFNSLGDKIETDRDLLKGIIKARLGKSDLIEKEAIEEAIDKSGANITQLIYIIHKSALKAMMDQSEFINKNNVNDAVFDLRLDLSSFVQNQLSFIKQVKSKKLEVENEETTNKIEKATANNIVFSYFNGATWYGVNPVCEETIEFYDKQTTNS